MKRTSMMFKKNILCLASLFLPWMGQAQEVLNLEQCREMALKNNKEMAAAARQTQGAHYTKKSFWGNFFPNISAYGTGIYSSSNGSFDIPGGNLPTFKPNNAGLPLPDGGFAYFPGLSLEYKVKTVYMGGIQLEQPIFMGGKILTAYKMAKIGEEMARVNEHLTATEVILETDNAYILLVKAQELKKVADSYHAVLMELLKNVESAKKHGLKPQNDVLKVQVKLNESELAIRKAENAIRLAQMNLNHYIGKPLTEKITISNDFPSIERNIDAHIFDITSRPEYQLLSQQVNMAKQQVHLSRSELLPQIGIRGSYDYIHGFKVNNENLFHKPGFSVLLNVSIPIFHFGERYHKVRAAKMKLEQTQLEQANLNEKMLLELTQSANNLDEAKLEMELAERSLEQATENQRVSKSHYDVGMESLSDHLEAQAMWQQAYQTKVDAHFQLYLNYIKYLKAAGRLHK